MSHFTYMETSFQNFEYLEKSLNKLTIPNYQKESSEIKQKSLIIDQSNNSNLTFAWNGEKYELISDLMLWKQPYTHETFLTAILKKYANEVIIGESSKIGFQPTELKQNMDGSNTIRFERWNND